MRSFPATRLHVLVRLARGPGHVQLDVQEEGRGAPGTLLVLSLPRAADKRYIHFGLVLQELRHNSETLFEKAVPPRLANHHLLRPGST